MELFQHFCLSSQGNQTQCCICGSSWGQDFPALPYGRWLVLALTMGSRAQGAFLLSNGDRGFFFYSFANHNGWRRKWQPTPVFLPGESQGRGRLVGYRRWGCTESDTTEATYQQQQPQRFFLPVSDNICCFSSVT